tara:strand:+ start:785 stop:1042 length:258 start_codon:yes stop_codon:yes gene_type:complete
MGRLHAEELVLAGQIPDDEPHLALADRDLFPVDLDPDGREVAFRKDALNEAAHQAGLPDGERAKQADLLLDHRKRRRSFARHRIP